MHRMRRVHVHRQGGDVLARRRRMRSVELVDVRAQSRGDMLSCREGWVAGMKGFWSRHVSPWRGEDRRWSTRKGGHDSPIFGTGLSELSLGLWLADNFLILWQKVVNKQAIKANGSEPEPSKYVPSGVTKLYLPGGCVTSTREKESPLIILRSEGRGPISYPGLEGIEPEVQYVLWVRLDSHGQTRAEKCGLCPYDLVRSTVSFYGNVLQTTELSDHSVGEDKCTPEMADEGKSGNCWTSNGHGTVGFHGALHENCSGDAGIPSSYRVDSLVHSQETSRSQPRGLHITTALYHLKDDVGGQIISLILWRRVRYHYVLSCYGPLDEGCILLDSGSQLNPLKVEPSMLGVLKSDRSLKEGPAYGEFGELW
ncbi:hypothetical protein CRG98_018000 [Punica granatum]|uniref:Uncharacterized protein n=1 Tax=Punica granatum TaxID=22663 RepID=A0A2I0JZ79_PUNGR|nr:hypothetical protein CRG98_018000 [Punica granatum]